MSNQCIQEFFTNPSNNTPSNPRPNPQDCLFFATHEPCSLCLSGITWAGFREFYYLFTYQDSRDLFAIPHDIDILQAVFRVPAPGDSDATLERRELYNRRNKFFVGRSVAELLGDVADESERARLGEEMARLKGLYAGLSETYQEGKRKGVESASVWQ